MEENNKEEVKTEEEIKKEATKKALKQNNTSTIITVILIIILLGTAGITMNDKFKNEEGYKEYLNEKDNLPEPTKTPLKGKVEIAITDTVVEDLYNKYTINYPNECWMRPLDLNESNFVRLRMTYKNAADEIEKDSDCKEFDTKINTNLYGEMPAICGVFAGSSEYNEMSEEELKNNKTSYIEEKDLKDKYINLFKNYNYTAEDFEAQIGVNLYHYVEAKNMYVLYGFGSGTSCNNRNQSLSKAYKDGNKLYLETVYLEEATKTKYVYEFEEIDDDYVFIKVTEGDN